MERNVDYERETGYLAGQSRTQPLARPAKKSGHALEQCWLTARVKSDQPDVKRPTRPLYSEETVHSLLRGWKLTPDKEVKRMRAE